MERTEKVELTALCLIYKDDNILLQDRVKNDWKGFTLPGGHIEIGESIVDAIIREMKEETGLTVLNPKLCGVKQFPIKDGKYENGRYLVFLFKANEFYGLVLLCLWRMDNSMATTGTEYARREEVNKELLALQAYTGEKSENFYFFDVYSSVKYSEKLFVNVREDCLHQSVRPKPHR